MGGGKDEPQNEERKTKGKPTMKREKKQQWTTSGEKGVPRNETIHPFLLLEEKNRAGSKNCTMGILMYIIGDERKQAQSQVQTE